jgi:hypothetical protein
MNDHRPARAILCAVSVFVLTFPVLQAAADPIPPVPDPAKQIVDWTVAYVQGWNPNDNTTTQAEKAKIYLYGIQDVLEQVLCAVFRVGTMVLDLTGIDLTGRRINISVPGFGLDTDQRMAGKGTYYISGSLNGSIGCLPLGKPVTVYVPPNVPLDNAVVQAVFNGVGIVERTIGFG